MIRRAPSTRIRHQWVVPVTLGLLGAILIPLGVVLHLGGITVPGVFAGIFALALTLDYFFIAEDSNPILGRRDPTRDRVKKLVAALSESTKVMEAIRREVDSNQQLVDRLQADVQTHQLLGLDRNEVEAVAQVVASEVRREGRRGLYVTLALNLLFFGLGVLVTLLIT